MQPRYNPNVSPSSAAETGPKTRRGALIICLKTYEGFTVFVLCLQTQPSEDHLVYASVHFSEDQAVYSNNSVAQARRRKKVKKEEETVVYDAVRFNHCASPALR